MVELVKVCINDLIRGRQRDGNSPQMGKKGLTFIDLSAWEEMGCLNEVLCPCWPGSWEKEVVVHMTFQCAIVATVTLLD